MGLLSTLGGAANGLLGLGRAAGGLITSPFYRDIEDPAQRQQALMALSSGLTNGGDLGGSYLGGLQLMQQNQEAAQQKKMREMQAQALQLQLAQAQKQAGNQQQLERIAPQIAGRMFGGPAGSAPGPTGGSPDGLNYVQSQAQYKADPMDAMRVATANAGVGGLDVMEQLSKLRGSGANNDSDVIQQWKADGDPDFMNFLRRRAAATSAPQSYAPQFTKVERTNADGTMQFGSHDDRTGKITWGEPVAGPDAGKQARANDTASAAVGNTRDIIKEALSAVSPMSAGFVGQRTQKYGGTPARDLDAKLSTIKANLSFDKLSQMRSESKTGGALGNVTEKELDLLSSAVAGLDQAQSPEQLKAALSRVDKHYSNVEGYLNQIRKSRGGYLDRTTPSQAPASDDPLGLRLR